MTHFPAQKPTKVIAVVQFGWIEKPVKDECPEITPNTEVLKVAIFPGMQAEEKWLSTISEQTQKRPFLLETEGDSVFDVGSVHGCEEGWTVVVSRHNWNALSTDSKLAIFENFNVMIPRSEGDIVWGDVEDWTSVDALEQHVPLHTQHCIHGALMDQSFRALLTTFSRSTVQSSRRQHQ